MKTRRILGVLLSAAITLCAVTGCGDEQKNSTVSEIEFPTHTDNYVQYDTVGIRIASYALVTCGIEIENDELVITAIIKNVIPSEGRLFYENPHIMVNSNVTPMYFEADDFDSGSISSGIWIEPGEEAVTQARQKLDFDLKPYLEHIYALDFGGTLIFHTEEGHEYINDDLSNFYSVSIDPPYEINWESF